MTDQRLHRRDVIESLDFAAGQLTTQAQVLRASHFCKETSAWDEPEIEVAFHESVVHAFRLRTLAKQIRDGKPRGERVAETQSSN